MKVIFEGRMHVAYGQAYVEPADTDDYVQHENDFAGQINGLLGAAEPSVLYLTTGMHTGQVGFRLVVAEEALDLSEEWEDVVEASFVPDGASMVVQWGGEPLCDFELPPVPHRVRYCARGMDEARDSGVVMSDEPLVDHYELVFWPAEPAPEQIVRVGSRIAEYWHDARDHEKVKARRIRSMWGENPPSERLIDVDEARWLVRRRRDLAESLAAASPAAQRAVAFWAARRACEATRIDQVKKVALALRLQGRNEILPRELTRRDSEDPDSYDRTDRIIEEFGLPMLESGRHDRAVGALVGADHENALVAALQALTEGICAFEFGEQDTFLDEAANVLKELSGEQNTADPRHDPYHGDFMKRHLWGDEPPHPRLIEVFAHELTAFDRALAEKLAEATPQTQRAIARWAARRAATAAGLAERFPEVKLALKHLERDEPLPAPFDGEDGSEYILLDAGEDAELSTSVFGWDGAKREQVHYPETPQTTESAVSQDLITVNGRENWSRPHFALSVIRKAADSDPLRAATETLWNAACSFGDEQRRSILREGEGMINGQALIPVPEP